MKFKIIAFVILTILVVSLCVTLSIAQSSNKDTSKITKEKADLLKEKIDRDTSKLSKKDSKENITIVDYKKESNGLQITTYTNSNKKNKEGKEITRIMIN